MWPLARGSLYSVDQLFVNFTAAEPNWKRSWKKEEMTVSDGGRFGDQVALKGRGKNERSTCNLNEPNPRRPSALGLSSQHKVSVFVLTMTAETTTAKQKTNYRIQWCFVSDQILMGHIPRM